MRVFENLGKTSWRPFAGSLLITTFFSVSAIAADKTTEMQHSVYVGGLFLGSINTEVKEDHGNYRISTSASSSKTFEWAFRWIAKAQSVGLIEPAKVAPFVHRHESAWNDNMRTATMNYTDSGKVTVKTTGKQSTDPNKYSPVDPASLTNSIDPMSAILQVTNQLEAGQKCNALVPVFDGRRRYDIKLTDSGEKLFKPSRYSVFQGEAIGCKIDIVKKGGFKRDFDENVQLDQDLIIWAAAPVEGGRIVPVRMQVDTDFGRVELHLERYSDGPVKLVSKNSR
jgi:hypothetical protein